MSKSKQARPSHLTFSDKTIELSYLYNLILEEVWYFDQKAGRKRFKKINQKGHDQDQGGQQGIYDAVYDAQQQLNLADFK